MSMQFKIKTFNTIYQSSLGLFPHDMYSVSEHEKEPDAIICRSADLHNIPFPPSLKAIARAGSGVNNIPVDRCTDAGLVVFNTLGANANAVKELVLASMLVSARNLFRSLEWVQSLNKDTSELDGLVEKSKKNFSGVELQNKTLGVIGLGAIGHKIANLGISFNMEVLGFDPYLSLENALQLSRQVVIVKSIEELIAKSDFITIHVGYTLANHHLIDGKLLSQCKKSAVVLNFARKDVVDEIAILSKLENDTLAQYICDFPSDSTLHHPRVICFPHLGASTSESEERCSNLVVLAIRNFLEKGIIQGSVNYPSCQLEATNETKYRLLIGNTNVANIVGQITHVLGNNSINIEDMINTHKSNLAYNIIDVDKVINASIVKEITNIPEVKFLRLIDFSKH